MKRRQRQAGFTLIELVVALAVMAVLALTAIPLTTDMLERQRVVAAAEAVQAQFATAKSESYKRSQDFYVRLAESGNNWAVGLSDRDNSCNPLTVTDPDASNACSVSYQEADGTTTRVLRVINSTMYPGTEVDSDASTFSFNWLRGTSTADTVEIDGTDSDPEYEVRLIVNPFGRMKMCSPATSGDSKKIGRYQDCP